jgi:aspartyl-tRNA(Asn)/glutamyl-tRNA(Gln) amidotransferase subunit A
MADHISLSLAAMATALRERRLRAVALFEESVARHARYESLNAYKLWTPDPALASARAADAAFEAGSDVGPLQGILVSVKDLFGTRGQPIFAGTRRELPKRFQAEGPLVRALKRQLAVVPGRTHTTEFAIGEYGFGTNTHWGTPRNPWDATTHRPCGGSSSGAGVSLHEGTAHLAFGSDTAGSVREPASLTGTAGLKVTWGRWSIEGISPLSPSFDTPGLLARTVEDVAYGFAALDPAPKPLAPVELAGLRIGVADDWFWTDCSPGIAEGVKTALDELARKGARLLPFPIPEARELDTVFSGEYDIMSAELYAFIREELPDWLGLVNKPNGRLLDHVSRMPAWEYLRKLKQVRDARAVVCPRMDDIDVLVMPTVPVTPPAVDFLITKGSGVGALELRNTGVVNLLGQCAISMPVALDAERMPVGLQIVAPAFAEERLLSIARAIEQTLGTARQRLGAPPMIA